MAMSNPNDQFFSFTKKFDRLLISPERLANERCRAPVLAKIAARISMLVVERIGKSIPLL